MEAPKMPGRARGRKGERKTYHINPYHHITMEFGGYLLNVAKNPTHARARKGEAQGVLSYQKATGIFDNPHVHIHNKSLAIAEYMDYLDYRYLQLQRVDFSREQHFLRLTGINGASRFQFAFSQGFRWEMALSCGNQEGRSWWQGFMYL